MNYHTPGPWKCEQLEVNKNSIIYTDLIPQGIANVYPSNESKANARLIAAAPEMLQWMENEARLYEGLAAEEFSPPTAKRISALRTIIAKATGETK